jgi:hypothetical protein
MSALRKLLRRWLLTADERLLIEAPRETVLRAMMAPEEWRVLAAVRAAQGYQVDPAVTKEDAEAWEALLRAPLGLKADTAMINWLHGQAQQALLAPTAEVLASAKFALGCRAGWEMGKSILRLAAAHSGESGQGDDTAELPLEHLKP